MKKVVCFLVFAVLISVNVNSQTINETIPSFCEKVLVQTNKEETVKFLKAKGFVIKSKDWIQNRYWLSDKEADRSVAGVGNYGFECMVDFAPGGKRVYMSGVKFLSFQGAMEEFAKSGYKFSHVNQYENRIVYTKTLNGYYYTIFAKGMPANDGKFTVSYELVREKI